MKRTRQLQEGGEEMGKYGMRWWGGIGVGQGWRGRERERERDVQAQHVHRDTHAHTHTIRDPKVPEYHAPSEQLDPQRSARPSARVNHHELCGLAPSAFLQAYNAQPRVPACAVHRVKTPRCTQYR